MASITVQSLIDRAVTAADMKDNFVETYEWLNWINLYHKELQTQVALLGVPYYLTDQSITVDGSAQYVISEPLAILAVYRLKSGGKLFKLEISDSIQRLTTSSHSGEPTRCFINRNANNVTISFYPNPDSGTVIVRLIPYPATLVLGTPGVGESNTVNYPLGWEEYIVLRTAEAALSKEETINPKIQNDISRVEQHIEVSGRNFIMGGNSKVRNIAQDNWGSYDWYFV